MTGDPNAGASWTRAGAAGDALSYQASPIFDELIDHEGGDVGSPGFAPGVVVDNLPGDYNDNGRVDAADYVVWKKLFGTPNALPNDPNVGTTIDQDQYNTWRQNFGRPATGHGSLEHNAVPEPAAFLLIAIVTGFALASHRSGIRGPFTAGSVQR